MAGRYRTEQERIDAMTVEISNPNVMGSGYIQHPPQRPFEKPLEVQPPTVAQFDFPTEYSHYNGGGHRGNGGTSRSQPRKAEAAHAHPRYQGHQPANGKAQYPHINGRPAQMQHSNQRSNGAGAAAPRTVPMANKPSAQTSGPRHTMTQPRQPLSQQPQPTAAAGTHVSMHAHAPLPGPPASARQETAVPNVAQLGLSDNARPAAKAEAEPEGPKLSKSQMMRLRKKKREGKI
ncbi:hypothetical protein COCOBI_12-3520 [Coccomyxa sp. Obi]|nr:hypothetical protein COCOBI_12-3520 [Coccomyxa sp. Obi]